MFARRTTTLLAVSLALVAGGAVSVSSQPFRMISTRGRDPGELRVWEVSSQGDLTELHLIPTGDIGFGHTFHVDPFSRFMVYANQIDHETVLDTYEIPSVGPPVFSQSFSRPGWEFFDNEHELTPDGAFLIALSRDNTDTAGSFYIETFSVSPSVELIETGGEFRIPTELLSEIGFDRAGSASLMDGKNLFFTTGRASTGYVNVFPITATGEVQWLVQQFAWPLIQPITGGFATRLDQRVVVTGPMGQDRLTSFAVSPEGRLSIIDAYTVEQFGGLAPANLTFHPGRRSLLSGDLLQSIPIERSGEFTQTALFGPGDGSGEMAVSPDGRIGVAAWDLDAAGIHWGVFALDPFGGIELIRDHTFPFGYTDIAFIPPRTEEVLGDANADARRDVADVVTYLNHFNDPGTYPEWHPLSPRIRGPVPEARADADQNGEITAKDLDWLIDFLLSAPAL